MNQAEKNKAFFNQVKGRKIYWTQWLNNDYTVPYKLLDKNYMECKDYNEHGEFCGISTWSIDDGFNDYLMRGACWKLRIDMEEELDQL